MDTSLCHFFLWACGLVGFLSSVLAGCPTFISESSSRGSSSKSKIIRALHLNRQIVIIISFYLSKFMLSHRLLLFYGYLKGRRSYLVHLGQGYLRQELEHSG